MNKNDEEMSCPSSKPKRKLMKRLRLRRQFHHLRRKCKLSPPDPTRRMIKLRGSKMLLEEIPPQSHHLVP